MSEESTDERRKRLQAMRLQASQAASETNGATQDNEQANKKMKVRIYVPHDNSLVLPAREANTNAEGI